MTSHKKPGCRGQIGEKFTPPMGFPIGGPLHRTGGNHVTNKHKISKKSVRPCFRGEVYYADLGQGVGSEQAGCRPVLILQNNVGNRYGATTIIAPLSCQIENKARLPTHVSAGLLCGLIRPSIVLLEQIRVIDKSRLDRRLGRLSEPCMRDVDTALRVSVGLV